MDPLSELVASVRARSSRWLGIDARAPWGVALAAAPGTFAVHHVTSGSAVLTTEEEGAFALGPDDIAVIPHGRAHILRDREESPCEPLEALRASPNGAGSTHHATIASLAFGGRGAATTVVSALVTLDDPFSVPLVASLPAALRLGGGGAAHRGLVAQLRLLAKEIVERPPGAELVLARIADVLFVQVMRAWVETLGDTPTHSCRSLELVAALRDPSLARALGQMSTYPERGWTVASLAEAAGLSRSAFAARFTSAVGEPPLAFLGRMRMRRATDLLREGATLARIAELTGYGSEASFSHAFRQWAGMAPGEWRRHDRHTLTAPEPPSRRAR